MHIKFSRNSDKSHGDEFLINNGTVIIIIANIIDYLYDFDFWKKKEIK